MKRERIKRKELKKGRKEGGRGRGEGRREGEGWSGLGEERRRDRRTGT